MQLSAMNNSGEFIYNGSEIEKRIKMKTSGKCGNISGIILNLRF
jgi:hypothetical protein